jgi:hypothetical protein
VFVPGRGPSFTEPQLREAIAQSSSVREALESIGLRGAGGNFRTLRKYAELWAIPTDHFQLHRNKGRTLTPLADVLVPDSSYTWASLKRRLFEEG